MKDNEQKIIELKAKVYDILNASEKAQYQETELFKSKVKQIQDKTNSEIAAINVQIEELKATGNN